MRTQAKPLPGTAQHVVAQAAIRRMAGQGPNLPFMGITNPVEALAAARAFLRDVAFPIAQRDALLGAVGEIVGERIRAGLPMDDAQFGAAVAHIVQTSTSRKQIVQRLNEELGYTGPVSMQIHKPHDAAGRQAVEIVRALTGGQIMANGAHNVLKITGPSGNRISV
jgi:hypothetical protein